MGDVLIYNLERSLPFAFFFFKAAERRDFVTSSKENLVVRIGLLCKLEISKCILFVLYALLLQHSVIEVGELEKLHDPGFFLTELEVQTSSKAKKRSKHIHYHIKYSE